MLDDKFKEQLMEKLGYIPIFHDDYIKNITFESENVIIEFQFLKENAKFFNKVEFKTDNFLKLHLKELSYTKVKGTWYCNNTVSLISELDFMKTEHGYELEFSPTCGLYGHFIAKSYDIIE